MSTTSPAVSKPLIIVLGAIVALAALFFLVIDPMLLSADVESESEAAALPVVPGSAAASPEPVATEEPSEEASGEPAPETFEIYSVRDPFQQLVQVAPVASATATPTPEPSDSEDPQATATATSTTVSMDQVGTDEGVLTASVTVDGQSFEVREGEAISGSFTLLAVAGQCGTFADGGEQFTLCQGEQIVR